MPTESMGSGKGRPRWLVPILAATSFLIVMAAQRPFLAMALVIAWLGARVGLGSDLGGCDKSQDARRDVWLVPFPQGCLGAGRRW